MMYFLHLKSLVLRRGLTIAAAGTADLRHLIYLQREDDENSPGFSEQQFQNSTA